MPQPNLREIQPITVMENNQNKEKKNKKKNRSSNPHTTVDSQYSSEDDHVLNGNKTKKEKQKRSSQLASDEIPIDLPDSAVKEKQVQNDDKQNREEKPKRRLINLHDSTPKTEHGQHGSKAFISSHDSSSESDQENDTKKEKPRKSSTHTQIKTNNDSRNTNEGDKVHKDNTKEKNVSTSNQTLDIKHNDTPETTSES